MPQYAGLVVRFTRIWEDFVNVSWKKELHDGAAVKKFHLLATGDNYKVERLFEATESSYRLVGLEPGTEIKVSLRAQYEGTDENDDWGTWSTATATTHNGCTIKVGMVGPDSIHGTFTWGKDVEDTPTHIYSRAASFQLRVRQKEAVLSSTVCDQELKPTQREFVVRDLRPDAIFHVQIRAVSQHGVSGSWSDVTRFLTLANVKVTVREVGEDYAVVWWGREGEEVGAPPPSVGSRTSIEQFSLRLLLHPSQCQRLSNPDAKNTIVDEQQFNGDISTFTCRNLLPGRIYSIETRQLNIQGDWSPWESFCFNTMNRTSMINIDAVSHNFLLISWEQERGEETDDEKLVNLSSDIVNWQVRCVNIATQEESTVVLPEREMSTRIVNLPSNTEFSLAARSKTAYGPWGLWGEAAFVTTLSELCVTPEAVGETWLKLNWSRCDKRYDDSVVRYHVQLSAADTPFRLSKYFAPEIVDHTFEDLTPATDYKISIQACFGDRWQSWSKPVPVRTAGPATIHLSRRGEDFIQIRWRSEFYDLNCINPAEQRFQLKVVRLRSASDTSLTAAGIHKQDDVILLQEFTNTFGHRITKLQPSSRVSIQVKAFNTPLGKWGSWCEPRCISTLQSVISFTMVGETCFEAAWQQKPRTVSAVDDTVPVEDDPLAPSEAVMYILRINSIDNDGNSTPLEKYHFTDEDNPFFLVEGLKPNHRYSAQLCTADSLQTWSPWSAQAMVTMMPPLVLTVLDIGEDYCKVCWKRMESIDGPVDWDESDTNYRIAATALKLDPDDGDSVSAGAQLKYFVEGETEFTLRHLLPDTSYRLSVSAYPKKTNVWGVWSEAVYSRTNPSIAVELDAVGEDYAHISWKRTEPSQDLEKLHPCCDIVRVGGTYGEDATGAYIQSAGSNTLGGKSGSRATYPLHVADASITEFNVKVYRVVTEADGEVTKSLEFETFLAYDHSTIRVPRLLPNTSYEAVACACNLKGEWGIISNALTFCTTLPTEMVVTEITQSYVKVKWGRDDADEDIGKYLIRIVGPDDDFLKEVTIPTGKKEYCIEGLGINCCYSVSVRAMHDGEWGHWSNNIFVALRAIRVNLVEASQDWLKVSWSNKSIPDGRQRKLFSTIMSNSVATTRTLPESSDNECVFTGLDPLMPYSIHLLCVEQVPLYIKCGGWVGSNGAQNHSFPESGRPADTNVTVTLPLISSDYSSFHTDSCSYSTLANITMRVLKVGENFVSVKWSREVYAHAAEAARESEAECEISCTLVNSQDDTNSVITRKVKGNEITVTHLQYNSQYELRVRKVSLLTSAWSEPVSVRTLDKVRVIVGPNATSDSGREATAAATTPTTAAATKPAHEDPSSDTPHDGSDSTQIGVGEDFIILNWEKGTRPSQATSYIVRCYVIDDDGNLVGEREEYSTSEMKYKLTKLQPDMRHKITVRSVVDDEGQLRVGEWSDELTLCTLSPMHVYITSITEETAEIQWSRRGESKSSSASVNTIGSYHLKVFNIPRPVKGGGDSPPPKILEECQLLESDAEFSMRCKKLTGLKPNQSYTAMIRASTENSWGAWSQGITFTTQPSMIANINLIGEECLFLSWERNAQQSGSRTSSQRGLASTRDVDTQAEGAVQLAIAESCELTVSTVGKDRKTITKTLPATPNHFRLDDLSPNMQYEVCLRPCYAGRAFGVWCEPIYCCTLPPLTVEVSRIGETFVHLKWQRMPQQRIAVQLREQQQHQQLEFAQQQRLLQNDIDALKGDDDDGGAFEREFLSQQDEEAILSLTTSPSKNAAKLQQLLKLQQQQQTQQKQLIKRQELQLLELERITKYPDGVDVRYEVVITGDDKPEQKDVEGIDDNDRRAAQPFVFRRRIDCDDGDTAKNTTSKIDCLRPHSSYTVTVRAMYNNGYEISKLAYSEDQPETLLWGAWSPKAELCTLKQISLNVRGVGSTHCVVDWDTGYAAGDAATAIYQYQLMVAEHDKKKGKPCQDIIIDNPNASTWTITNLQVNTQYTVTVRVCYDDERWGLWSNAITILTLPELSARVTEVGENCVSVLVWREPQKVNDPSLLVWRQSESELQLSINDMPSPSTFKLDLDTSTLLTLDDLTIDSNYHVKAREIDANQEWREWQDAIEFETLPAAPAKPTLDERRGNVISLSWHQRRNRENVQYLYCVEMAYTSGHKSKSGSGIEHGVFQPVGLLRSTSIRLELTEPVHKCLFKVKVCKEHQQLADDQDPNGDGHLWSQYSSVAHFHAPSVPQPPTQLKIVNLRESSATLKWKKPENWRSHTNVLYKVYLSASYNEKPLCLGSTTKCSFKMENLIPNSHYRVGCTAESSMGVSQNNHVLHFSTRVLSDQGPLHGASDNPTSSTLPPRNSLRLPVSEMERLGIKIQNAGSPKSAHSPHQSVARSEYTDEYSSVHRNIKAHFSPSVASYASHGAASAKSFLPPVKSPSPNTM
eukprot:TRINITY_DN1173_c3_g2_i1.p1 TRINITY_DN1173_c3_g2~~TRINITY_DN1173_c3_g2_i1.p1  ORF type:complete len:2434 (+),score=422.01 TRINITY_DN1173_c3_g2_i1:80-7381(+)